MVIETGKPIAQVARDLGIHDGTLGNWVNAWRREHPEPDQPLSPVERARVKELEDENRRLRMENEFLKKAAAFFARTQPGAWWRVRPGGCCRLARLVDIAVIDATHTIHQALRAEAWTPHQRQGLRQLSAGTWPQAASRRHPGGMPQSRPPGHRDRDLP